ncbi:MAG: hypothetical protein N4A46_00980, partial [Schleiferiaceae bacterium]|nr:hypothetical protein [Schleiferiaceae bacterium]
MPKLKGLSVLKNILLLLLIVLITYNLLDNFVFEIVLIFLHLLYLSSLSIRRRRCWGDNIR